MGNFLVSEYSPPHHVIRHGIRNDNLNAYGRTIQNLTGLFTDVITKGLQTDISAAALWLQETILTLTTWS